MRPQQRRCRGARVERDRIERLAEPDLRVQPDEIDQLERSHLVAQRDLDRRIDPGRVGDPGLDGADRVVVERDQQRIEDEARLILRQHRALTAAFGPGPGGSQRLRGRCSSPATSRSASSAAPAGSSACPTTRSSRPQPEAISVIDSVEVFEAKIVWSGQIPCSMRSKRLFDRELLEDGLDHQVAGPECGRVGHGFEAGQGWRRDRPGSSCRA